MKNNSKKKKQPRSKYWCPPEGKRKKRRFGNVRGVSGVQEGVVNVDRGSPTGEGSVVRKPKKKSQGGRGGRF